MASSFDTSKYTFQGDGTTVTFSIPMVIYTKTDITIYMAGTDGAVPASDYSVVISDYTSSSTFSLTFTSAPASGVNVLVYRDTTLTDPTPIATGSAFDSSDVNSPTIKDFIALVDAKTRYEDLTLHYASESLNSTMDPTDTQLPVLNTPSSGFNVWAKNTAGKVVETAIDAAGDTTADELKDDLADATSSNTGAQLVGTYHGGVASTVDADINKILATATSLSTGGANHINCYATSNRLIPSTGGMSLQDLTDIVSYIGGGTTAGDVGATHISVYDPSISLALDLQAFITSMFTTATSTLTGKINSMTTWDTTTSTAINVGGTINKLIGTPAASSVNYGAGYVKYWNGTASVTVKSEIDSLRERVPGESVGDFIPGKPASLPTNGSWLTIPHNGGIYTPSHPDTPPAGFVKGAQYEALYKHILTAYLGFTSAQADTAWSETREMLFVPDPGGTPPITTDYVGDAVSGTNTWRYA